MEKGTLVEFRLHGERRLAVADRPEGKKHWIAIDQWGQSHTIHPRQVEYEVRGGPQLPTEIPAFLQDVETYLDPSSLEVAWELLLEEEGSGVTPEELAQFLFSDEGAVACYTAHSLLVEDKFYFKKKGQVYEPRPPAQVAELKHQLEIAQQREQEKAGFFARVKLALAGERVEWVESDRPRLEALEQLALYPDRESKLAQEILAALSKGTTAAAAFELLTDIGRWSRHENVYLRRSGHPTQFPQQVRDLVRQHLASPPDDLDRDRLDLTALKVYTIDDESTREIDDGLSVETLPDSRQRLWIHIADPTRFVMPDDELDKEARRRSTTLYLPTGMIPMFPEELATGPMSLVQGQLCPALSFGAVLSESGEIEEYSLHAALVKPTYRLTYDDVDEMLQLGVSAEAELEVLARGARQRQDWRRSQGSIEILMPESSIKVDENEEIAIETIENSISRQLVAEMMILAGEIAGRYARDREVPLPFRGQPQPELPSEGELLQLPAGPVRYCAIRGCMPRSETGIAPARHAGLGLEIYTQVTSPIRRYMDLLAHYQLKAHLRGDPLPFTAEQVQEITFSASSAAYEATLVERQTKRYWGLEYLRRHSKEIWQALVLRWLREDDNLGIVLLEDLALELPHRFQRSVALGDRLEIQVSAVDPHQELIRFREVSSESDSETLPE